LSIDITYKDESDSSTQGRAARSPYLNEGKCKEEFIEEMRPNYTWIKNLKSLVILVNQAQLHVKDDSTEVFIVDWLHEMQADRLEQLTELKYASGECTFGSEV